MAQASRALADVSRLHGFEVEEVHVPFGSEALSRSGQPLPAATRHACLEADAVLVAAGRDPALGRIEAELDLRATATRVRFAPAGDVLLLSPVDDDSARWAVERAFGVARTRRARVTSIGDGAWQALVEEASAGHPGVDVERLGVAAGLPAVAFETDRFDVVVAGPMFASVLAEVAASTVAAPRVAATGRLAGHGPGVFAPSHGAAFDIAGQGVANPSSLLLATALLLAEGLAERSAAETLAGAVSEALAARALTPDLVSRGVAATTTEFVDAVLAGLPGAVGNVEFHRGAFAL
jgi:isocitrate/isopropylmalate dehydrogenase